MAASQRAAIDQAAAGTTAVVAAPGAGYHIEVISYSLSMTPAGTYQWKSATTALTGNMPLGAAPFQAKGDSDNPVLVCAANEALNLVSVTGAADGNLVYQIVSS